MPDTDSPPPRVVLCTLNARYSHASLGLRYLLANMGGLRAVTELREFTVARPVQDIATELMALLGPAIVGRVQVLGLGVYIWNVEPTTRLLRLLRAQRPALKIVLGGPEVSHEPEAQDIVTLADHVITGWGDVSFPQLCQALLHGPRPLMKRIAGEQPPLTEIALPYDEYTDADLAHRVVYVEASRGCPFKCAFCLSALDRTTWAFDLPRLLQALDKLHRRGARNFKFVDRTFNLKPETADAILQFFLERLPGLFVHFELIPDHLPARLRETIRQFPPGALQFEVGVQTFNPEVQRRIARVQDNARTESHLRWLVTDTQAHVHADLIFGLPGESLESFAQGFDRLWAIRPQEIQLGVLKRLRGTPMTAQGGAAEGLLFDERPPYTVLQTPQLSAQDLQQFRRLARYWDLIANSGRFRTTLVLLLGPPAASAFGVLWRLSEWLWRRTGSTHRLTPELLIDHLADFLRDELAVEPAVVEQALLQDYLASGARARPRALRARLAVGSTPVLRRPKAVAARQAQHLALSNGPLPQPPPDAENRR